MERNSQFHTGNLTQQKGPRLPIHRNLHGPKWPRIQNLICQQLSIPEITTLAILEIIPVIAVFS